MPPCPRCGHPAPQLPTTCTQCGLSIPATADPKAASLLPRVLLLVLMALLLAVLVGLALIYLGEAGRLGLLLLRGTCFSLFYLLIIK
jgi:hypothetical protein